MSQSRTSAIPSRRQGDYGAVASRLKKPSAHRRPTDIIRHRRDSCCSNGISRPLVRQFFRCRRKVVLVYMGGIEGTHYTVNGHIGHSRAPHRCRWRRQSSGLDRNHRSALGGSDEDRNVGHRSTANRRKRRRREIAVVVYMKCLACYIVLLLFPIHKLIIKAN